MQHNAAIILFACIAGWLTASSFSQPAIAYDPYASGSGRYGENLGTPPQPDFSKQWWEDGYENQQNNARGTTGNYATGGSTNCRESEQRLRDTRLRLTDELRRYATCIERATLRDDCSRDFDAVKRLQLDQEDSLRSMDRQCR